MHSTGADAMSLADLSHLERAVRLAELCELAYAPKPALSAGAAAGGFTIEPFHYHVSLGGASLGLSGFLAARGDDVVLIFCGSRLSTDQLVGTLANWTINLAVTQVAGYGGRVHRGFANALAEVWEDVSTRIQARCSGRRLWIAGHSLGGALGTLAACRLAEQTPRQDVAMVYTFGAPRVGDRAFADNYRVRHFRFENRNDLVAYLCPPPDDLPGWLKALAGWAVQQVLNTEVPDSVFNYRHVGQCQFLAWDGTLKEEQEPFSFQRLNRLIDAVNDHRMSSYVSALRALRD